MPVVPTPVSRNDQPAQDAATNRESMKQAAGGNASSSAHAAASPPPAEQQSTLQSLWGVIATALSVVYTAILAPPTALFAFLGRPHVVSWISRRWSRMILRTCGVKAEIDGLERLSGLSSYVAVSNHQSLFDILALLAWMPGEPRFVAKQELSKIPFIGYAMRHAGHVMIDRERGGASIRRVAEVAKQGFPIMVFAEGHRFSDNQVHPFNDGAAWIGILTKLKCVPMAISGTARFYPRGARIVRPGQRMRIAIGEPIDTADMRGADREVLTRQLEDAVRALFRSEV
jgi:1-acyl-sn-glycerol-3-phosphate acyltransferase